MKKTIFFIAIVIFVSGCVSSSKLSKSGDKEIKLVEQFLDDMVAGIDDFTPKYRSIIAPSYLKSNKLDIKDYSINRYYPDGYSIVSYNPANGYVITNIWGEKKTWIKELTFKVVKENGKLYLYPLKHTNMMYIHPWFEIKDNVKTKSE
ncbi:MAG: hypothetical protein JXR68_01645 [Bacteroidales bacterium]|nr:hypothetical protein [Bacteroidales bacterium]